MRKSAINSFMNNILDDFPNTSLVISVLREMYHFCFILLFQIINKKVHKTFTNKKSEMNAYGAITY